MVLEAIPELVAEYSTGRVAVVPGEIKGTLYYRVRVLDLPNKEIAGKIALQLEQTHHLSPRWVGKQQ